VGDEGEAEERAPSSPIADAPIPRTEVDVEQRRSPRLEPITEAGDLGMVAKENACAVGELYAEKKKPAQNWRMRNSIRHRKAEAPALRECVGVIIPGIVLFRPK